MGGSDLEHFENQIHKCCSLGIMRRGKGVVIRYSRSAVPLLLPGQKKECKGRR